MLNRAARALGHADALDAGKYLTEPLITGPKQGRRLTASGAEVARRARAILLDIDALVSLGDTAGNTPIALRFTCYPSHLIRFRTVLVPARSTSRRLEPVDVGESQRSNSGSRIEALLRAGRVLLAIGPAGLSVPQHVRSSYLYTAHLRAVVDRDSVVGQRAERSPTARQISIDDLANFQIAVAPPGHRSHTVLRAAFEASGLDFTPALEVSDVGALEALSDGVRRLSIMPDDFAGFPPKTWWPVVVDRSGRPFASDHHIYWNSRSGGGTALDEDVERLAASIVAEADPESSDVS